MTDWVIEHLEHFTPLSTWKSDGLNLEMPDRFEAIVERVRYQLRTRSDEELVILIEVTDALLKSYFSDKNEWGRIRREFIEDSEEFNPIYAERSKMFGPTVSSYLDFADEYDLRLTTLKIDITWPEIFCLLALNELGWGIEESISKEARNSNNCWMKSYGKLDTETYFLFDAFELLSAAERLADDNIDDLFSFQRKRTSKIKQSNQTSKSASSRWASTNKLKQRYINWYFANLGKEVFRNRTDAPEIFWTTLTEKEKVLVSDPNTFAKALRKHFKTAKR